MPASNSFSIDFNWMFLKFNLHLQLPTAVPMRKKNDNQNTKLARQSSETPEKVIRILSMASGVSQSLSLNLQLSKPLPVVSKLSNHQRKAVHLEVSESGLHFIWWPYWLLRQLNEASPSIDFAFEPKFTEPNRLWQPSHWLRAIHACHSDCSKPCAFLHDNTWYGNTWYRLIELSMVFQSKQASLMHFDCCLAKGSNKIGQNRLGNCARMLISLISLASSGCCCHEETDLTPVLPEQNHCVTNALWCCHKNE